MRIANKLHLIATTSLTLTLATLVAQPAAAQDALPTGGSVVAGAATIGGQTGGAQTITQTSQRAVIDWTSFNVGQGNTLTFVQPNADGATLNRVTGTTGSTIAGQIIANGSVYLINPNGIQITQSGVVNAGRGFVASTLDISNSEFMAGAGRFAGSGGAIDNRGSITVGSGGVVGLLGGSVSSSGLIVAPAGKVVIGAVTQATLDLNGGGFLQVALPDQAVLTQDGSAAAISAQAGYDATRKAVNLDGLSAISVTGRNGDVVLGGKISVDSGAGDAGSIVVMGNNTRADGELSARATGAGGNGGLIETSGNFVDFTGLRVDTRGANGATGTWLIDPTDLTVDAAAAATIQSNLTTSNVTLQTNLNGTTSGPGGTSPGAGDIIVASAISWGANTLTLNAANDIKVNAVLTASGSAGLALNYGDTQGSSSATPVAGAGLDFGLTSSGFTGRVDFIGGGASFGVNGDAYTIITSLGAAGSTTGADLQGVNGALNGFYALGADIDASATSGWNGGAGFDPLGATDATGGGNGFTGSFLGLGHTVSNLTINRPGAAYVGLFGRIGVGSSVGQVGVVNVIVSANGANGANNSTFGSGGAGGAGGVAGGLVGVSDGDIAQSYVTGTVTANGGGGGNAATGGSGGSGGAGGKAGGLVGVSHGMVAQSYAAANVSANGGGGGGGGSGGSGSTGGNGGVAGGLIGESSGTVISSNATGAVYANGGGSREATGAIGSDGRGGTAGGLVGRASGGTITLSYATGAVSANGAGGGRAGAGGVAGGLVGETDGSITESYATGAVSAAGGAGGAIGASASSQGGGGVGGTAGGLAGKASNGTIAQSHATGTVSTNGGNANSSAGASGSSGTGGVAGGLVGEASSETITQSYAIGQVYSNGGSSVSGVGAGGVAGGLVGRSSASQIVQSYAAGVVYANGGGAISPLSGSSAGGVGGVAGGLVGQADGAIIQSYATGAVYAVGGGGSSSMGFGGGGAGGAGGKAGGLAGTTIADITQSFATGAVSAAGGQGGGGMIGFPVTNGAAGVMGGVAAVASGGTIQATYWDRYASGQAVGVRSNTGATITSLASVTSDPTQWAATDYIYTPSAWSMFATAGVSDIDTQGGQALTWRMYDGFTTPMLKAFLQPGTVAVQVGDATTTYNGALQRIGATVTAPGGVDMGLVLGAGQGRNVGQYATGAYSIQQGYDLIVTAGSLTITPKALTITGAVASGAYSGATQSHGYTATGLVGGDTVTSVAGLASGLNVGTYADHLSGATGSGLSNYAIAYVNGGLTITPKALTVTYTAQAANSTYGDAPTLTGAYSVSGLVGGDTLLGSASWATTATAASGVGTYAVTGSGLSAGGNYTLTAVQASANAGALTITPRALTLTGNTGSIDYNGAFQGNGFTATGLVNGDTVTSVAGLASGLNVGTYADHLSGATGSGLSNYAIAYVNGGLTITPKALTVIGNVGSFAYDGGVRSNGFTTSGLVGSDTVTSVAGLASGLNVGTYADHLSGATGSGLSNYAIAYVNGGLTITPKALTVTYTAQGGVSIVYGEAFPSLTGGYVVAGLIGGDTLSGSARWTTTATTTSGVGTYAVNGSGLSAGGNYLLTAVQASANASALTITPRAITVTADAAGRAYGAPNPALTWTLGGQGLVNGDTLSGALATTAGATSPAGDYAIIQGDLKATPNYTMTFVSAVFSVSPAPSTQPPSRVVVDAAPATTTPMTTATGNGGDLVPPPVSVSFSAAEVGDAGEASKGSAQGGGGCQTQGDKAAHNCRGQSAS